MATSVRPTRAPNTLAAGLARSRPFIPVRHRFVTGGGGRSQTPCSQLVGTRGRGGAVALKLYLALIWRCSAPPFTTDIPARQWADLLELPDPDGAGRRRIIVAMQTLSKLGLVHLTTRPGDTTEVALLEESGTGHDYAPPTGVGEADRYFKVPARLFANGTMPDLGAPAVGMLLALLSAERGTPRAKVWWSTRVWRDQVGFSASSRAQGTKELVDAGIVKVRREAIGSPARTFAKERVRNTYHLTALIHPTPKKAGGAKRAAPPRRRRVATKANTP